MIDATINLPSSAQSVDQRSIEHGSAASMLPAVVRAPASPKPKCRKMVVATGLKMTKVGKGMRPSSGPSEDLRDALKAFEAKTDSHADRLAQIEGHGRVVAATVDLLSASVDSRFAVLAAELNQYAVQIEQGKAAVEASLQAHLARIDSTFQQCDAILGTTQELMSSSPVGRLKHAGLDANRMTRRMTKGATTPTNLALRRRCSASRSTAIVGAPPVSTADRYSESRDLRLRLKTDERFRSSTVRTKTTCGERKLRTSWPTSAQTPSDF